MTSPPPTPPRDLQNSSDDTKAEFINFLLFTQNNS